MAFEARNGGAQPDDLMDGNAHAPAINPSIYNLESTISAPPPGFVVLTHQPALSKLSVRHVQVLNQLRLSVHQLNEFRNAAVASMRRIRENEDGFEELIYKIEMESEDARLRTKCCVDYRAADLVRKEIIRDNPDVNPSWDMFEWLDCCALRFTTSIAELWNVASADADQEVVVISDSSSESSESPDPVDPDPADSEDFHLADASQASLAVPAKLDLADPAHPDPAEFNIQVASILESEGVEPLERLDPSSSNEIVDLEMRNNEAEEKECYAPLCEDISDADNETEDGAGPTHEGEANSGETSSEKGGMDLESAGAYVFPDVVYPVPEFLKPPEQHSQIAEKLPQKHLFEEIGLSGRLRLGLDSDGIVDPTPLQEIGLPEILKSQSNVVVEYGHRTGKTKLAVITLVHKYENDTDKFDDTKWPVGIIMCSNENAAQEVQYEINELGRSVNAGMPLCGLARQPSTASPILVGTPKMLAQFLTPQQGTRVKTFIIDGIGGMTNFLPAVYSVFSRVNGNTQTIVFAREFVPYILETTLDGLAVGANIFLEDKTLAMHMRDQEEFHTVPIMKAATTKTKHFYTVIPAIRMAEVDEQKIRFLVLRKHILQNAGLCYIFCSANEGDWLACQLQTRGVVCRALTRSLESSWEQNECYGIFILTDGIRSEFLATFSKANLVVNYNFPSERNVFQDRIGLVELADDTSKFEPRMISLIKFKEMDLLLRVGTGTGHYFCK